jgi:hypothetical protein
MPAESLDDWEEVACWEVERQAFIDTSLGPQEFQGNSKKDQQCDKPGKWKRGTYQKAEWDPDAIDVNIACMQNSNEMATKEKQCSEGRCFLCNKMGHLKRNCPAGGKGNNPAKSFCASPVVRTTQVQSEEDNGMDMKTDQMALLQAEGLMAQLWGMLIEERDEMIDTLIRQENF